MKRFYTRTNKVNAIRQIAKQEHRYTRLRRAREAAKANHHRKHIHHVGFSENDPLPRTSIDLHHQISDSTRYSHHLLNFVQNPPNDPSKKVCSSWLQSPLTPHQKSLEFYSKAKEPFIRAASWP